MTSETPVLFPLRICETRAGNFAHTVGRLAFRQGRPMLVEHVGGIFLEHSLDGRVMTPGYGDDHDIVHVWEEERLLDVCDNAAACGAFRRGMRAVSCCQR